MVGQQKSSAENGKARQRPRPALTWPIFSTSLENQKTSKTAAGSFKLYIMERADATTSFQPSTLVRDSAGTAAERSRPVIGC